MADFALIHAFDEVAVAVSHRPCLLAADRTRTFGDVRSRTIRLAGWLASRGVVHHESVDSPPHLLAQPRVAIVAHNCPEYIEAMLASYRARAIPFNVNYRYVAEELQHVLRDGAPVALVVQSSLADRVRPVLDELRGQRVVLQIDDEPGVPLLPEATWFEDAVEASGLSAPLPMAGPEDRYLLYTGGTTGMPKGVIWRQCDIVVRGMGMVDQATGLEFDSLASLAANAVNRAPDREMPAAPFMHGGGHWLAFRAMLQGMGVVIAGKPRSLDPADILDRCDEADVGLLMIIGEAFAGPLVKELRERPRKLPRLHTILTGGVGISEEARTELHRLLPEVRIVETAGSSETGGQMVSATTAGSEVESGVFEARPDTVILSPGRTSVLDRSDPDSGWLASTGRVPLGYFGDQERTERCFAEVDGIRYIVPGDRAQWTGDGRIRLLGRDSITINSGGEKIFAEEVEAAIRKHPGVEDVVVCGVPHPRWGQQVSAVVSLHPGSSAAAADLQTIARAHIASYKVPRLVVFVTNVERGPAGKADYRWAQRVAAEAALETGDNA